MRAAGIGTTIVISSEGPEAEAAVSALGELVDRGFDEGE
jgi:phosphocarrier protein HPr